MPPKVNSRGASEHPGCSCTFYRGYHWALVLMLFLPALWCDWLLPLGVVIAVPQVFLQFLYWRPKEPTPLLIKKAFDEPVWVPVEVSPCLFFLLILYSQTLWSSKLCHALFYFRLQCLEPFLFLLSGFLLLCSHLSFLHKSF